jgi:hypothetical protein
MPDWEREVQRRLKNTKFPSAGREEVARELAGYLDDLSDESRFRGAGESSAAARATHELNEDPRLGAHLYRARQEGIVNDRTKQLWLPLAATFCASFIVGALIQIVLGHFSHQLVLHDEGGGTLSLPVLMGQDPMVLGYFLWLYTLVFIGAAGAYWSRRAGSGRMLQAAVALFPALLFMAVFVGDKVAQWQGTIPVRFVLLESPTWGPFLFLHGASGDVLGWIIIPCAALVLGAAGVYWSRRAGARRILQAAVALFPVLVFLAGFARMEVLQHEGSPLVVNFPHARVCVIFGGPSAALWTGIVIPGAALLLGVLPFLLRPAKRPHEISSAVSAQ